MVFGKWLSASCVTLTNGLHENFWQLYGVQVFEHPGGPTILNHSENCSSIQQMGIWNVSDKEPLKKEECQQLRAISELQWRAYQTGPQHGACLSILQSQMSNLTIATAREAIRLGKSVWSMKISKSTSWKILHAFVGQTLQLEVGAISPAPVGTSCSCASKDSEWLPQQVLPKVTSSS